AHTRSRETPGFSGRGATIGCWVARSSRLFRSARPLIMPATVTSITPRRTSGQGRPPQSASRRPFRDNPRLILAGIGALVAVLLGMTLVPAVLVLAVGSELIRTSVERWFNAPMDEILTSANQIAGDYYHERQMLVSDHAKRIARALASVNLGNPDVRPLRDLLAPDVTLQRVQMVEVYRVGRA